MNMTKSTWRLYAAAFVLSAAVALAVLSGVFEHQEMAAYDFCMRSRPPRATHPGVAVIEISDDTLTALGSWPIPRRFHAVLVKALSSAGCRIILFDALFSEQSESDDAFAEAMREAGNVFLPVAFRIDESDARSASLTSGETVGGLSHSLQPGPAGTGHINIFVDPDGKVRRLPLWVGHKGTEYPALGLLGAASALGVSPDNVSIPSRNGSVWVNFPGAWTGTFSHYSYIDVLKAYAAQRNGESSPLNLSEFKNKVCFVGLTATGTSDFRANPYDSVYPMLGTQASLCDSILSRSFVRRLSPSGRVCIDILLAVSILFLCLRLAPLSAGGAVGACAVLYAVCAWSLFALSGLFIDVWVPLAIIPCVYGAVLLRRFMNEAQQRRLLEKELEIAASIQRSFLPPDIRTISGMRVRSFLEPAKFVGGDLYDIIALDCSSVGVFIGDVSGKGVSAALIMAQAVSLLRVLAVRSRHPAEVLEALNVQLVPLLRGRFITAQYLIIHGTEGYWEGSCAGHLPFLHLSASGELRQALEASGPPLGMMANVRYSSLRETFAPGDRIFMFTDGWIEGRNEKGAEFGIDRLKEAFCACGKKSGFEALLPDMRKRMSSFTNKVPQFDDIAAIALELSAANPASNGKEETCRSTSAS